MIMENAFLLFSNVIGKTTVAITVMSQIVEIREELVNIMPSWNLIHFKDIKEISIYLGRSYYIFNFSQLGIIFDVVDFDGSGTVDKEELGQMIKGWSIFQRNKNNKPNYVSKLLDVGIGFAFHLADADFSASLDKDEFERYYNGLHRIIFDLMDEDGNGSLSLHELVEFDYLNADDPFGVMEYNKYEILIRPTLEIGIFKSLILKKYQGSKSESGYEYDKHVTFNGILKKILNKYNLAVWDDVSFEQEMKKQ